MIFSILFLGLASPAGALSPEPPFHLQRLSTDRDIGAVNENFRNLSDYLRKMAADVSAASATATSAGIAAAGISTQTVWLLNTSAGSTGQCPAGSSVTATVGNYPLEYTFWGTCYIKGVDSAAGTVSLNVLQNGAYIDNFSASKFMVTKSYTTNSTSNIAGYGPCGRTYRSQSAVAAGVYQWCLAVVTTSGGAGTDAQFFCDSSYTPCSLEIREFRGSLAP